MNTKSHKNLISVLAILYILITYSNLGFANEKYKDMKDFEEVIDIIHNQYINKVDNKQLMQSAINGMLDSLDPYSTFLTKEEYDDMKSSAKGEFGGIGVEINMEQGFLKVVSSYKNLPAYRAGIKPGDIIVMINDEAIGSMSIVQASDKLKGEPGSTVKLKIYRDSGEIKEVVITRDVIKLIPTKVLYYNQDKVIYAKIGNFSEKTSLILKNELLKIINNHNSIKGLILDLRDNPGGILDQAVEVSRLFLNDGIIVSIKTRHNNEEISYDATGADIIKGLPIVILINNGSASSSEIVAGALQDNKRALVMGEKSFCKGLVQNLIPFSNGSAIKLTTAKFYTPLGKSIQEECIIPNIEIISPLVNTELNNDTNNAIIKNNNHKNLKNYQNDYVLLRAIDLVKGISLYTHDKNE
ncbi:S41 family peptidase [Candidatus Aquarickettsia rohweri]|uniref:S41 family peptidase n=1 Tax=Candidatus Aquarickettsia rohweri TaxID=2602574 RepID=UPI00196A3ADF|nr:S41 family peptidase [Candidatus Aquarickettsia rohweri]